MALSLSWSADRSRAALVFSHDPGNLLTGAVVAELRAAIARVAGETHLKLVTIEGEGTDFSFGASIPEHAPEVIGRVLADTHALVLDLLAVSAPTAAIVRGRCLGGGFELALACDFIFAAESAIFALPEIALGVFPPAATVLLPLRVGAAGATSAVLTGAPRSAAEWQAAGVVERVAPADDLARVVDAWFASTFAPRSAEALRHAVRAVRLALAGSVARELPVVERLYLDELMRSHDAREGVQAFLDKRPPRWEDR